MKVVKYVKAKPSAVMIILNFLVDHERSIGVTHATKIYRTKYTCSVQVHVFIMLLRTPSLGHALSHVQF